MDTPRGFIPVQDQSTITISITMPPGSSLARTDAIVQRVVPIVLDTPGVSSASVYSGMDGITFSPSTSSGQMWAILDPFEKRMPRGPDRTAIAAEIRKRLAPDLGSRDPHRHARAGARPGQYRRLSHDGRGSRRPGLSRARGRGAGAGRGGAEGAGHRQAFSNFNTRNPTLDAVVDRDKAEMLGVPVRNVFATLQTYLAGSYVNNITLLGHTFQVIAQGDAGYRQDQAWVGNLKTRSASGAMVPIGAIATVQAGDRAVSRGALQPVSGGGHPGRYRRRDIPRARRWRRWSVWRANICPRACTSNGPTWPTSSRSPGGAGDFAFVLGVLFVFIFLAALYESITLPLAVILIVPMCLLAAILGVNARTWTTTS